MRRVAVSPCRRVVAVTVLAVCCESGPRLSYASRRPDADRNLSGNPGDTAVSPRGWRKRKGGNQVDGLHNSTTNLASLLSAGDRGGRGRKEERGYHTKEFQARCQLLLALWQGRVTSLARAKDVETVWPDE
jgi:hypothetical protein